MNHEIPPLSINDAKDVIANLINISTAAQNPKYHENHNQPVIWLRRFMKAHNVNYVKELYQEELQFTQDEASDM